VGVHGQTVASTKQCNKHKELHHKNNTVCMCITIRSPQNNPNWLATWTAVQCRLHIQRSQLTRN